jgi:hypothetical protein
VMMALEDLQTIGAVEHPDRFELRRNPRNLWTLGELDPTRIAAVLQAKGGCAENGNHPPLPPSERDKGFTPFSAQPLEGGRGLR